MPLLQEAVERQIESRKLTFKDVETLTSVSEQTVIDVLAGKVPRSSTVKKLCDGLGIDVNDIVTDPNNISVHEAAVMMSKSDNYVRQVVENGTLPGSYTASENGIRDFHIPRRAFEAYMGMQQSFSLEMLVDLLADEIVKRLNLNQQS